MGSGDVDLKRMRAARLARLSDAMAAHGLDGLILVGASNQEYAGIGQPCADAMRIHYEAVVAIVPAKGAPHVWTAWPELVMSEIPRNNVRAPIAIELDAGVDALARAVREVLPDARRIGLDELTGPMLARLPALLRGIELCDGTVATLGARLQKTADEVACIREAQRINEIAMVDVEAALKPGVRQNELSAIFFKRCFELGASSSIIDPIWSLTPKSVSCGTITANGDVGFPLASNDRFLREGDLILSDTGISWNGYHSDFGKTWICAVDPKPSPELRACYERWRELMDEVYAVLRPGATSGDLVRAAEKVEKKYKLAHYYLGHGLGVDSAEPPIVGADLGRAFDDAYVLRSGMVFVLEPVVWRDGVGGYRSEEIIHVTETGFEKLTSYGYSPFE
ncbi:MAG TPA: Xaa-Pro peptidase family protein [Alphaproteobacteria bacterium]|nr:Xaa-Pro peptidase family protein [Alphaproteobacteria bacterium]